MTKEKLTVNELFSGIGAQRKALERLGIPHEVIGICEIDKYAIQSYEAIFGATHNYGDISKVERLNYADLWTYSFPCQDISVAGNLKGISQGTRSGLLYEVQRLLDIAKEEGTLPKYLLLENVKNLVGKKFKGQFDNWLFYLDQLGYNSYWQVLNAKNYGIPQNRERVFVVSIRKDLNETFEFPKAEELTKRLADILEDEVDEKYYLSNEIQKRFKLELKGSNIVGTTAPSFRTIGQRDIVYGVNGVIGSLVATDYKQPKQIIELPCIGASRGRNPDNPSDRTVGAPTQQRLEINIQGTSNTITTVQKDNFVVEKQPLIIDDTQQGFNGIRCYENYAPTLRASRYGLKTTEGLRIRKLTPLECWRLMGFDDEDFQKAEQSGVSNTQLYKQAGNSIVVDVLEKIFKNLYRK